MIIATLKPCYTYPMSKFSITEALSFGWNTTRHNFGFLLKVMLVIVGINFVSQILPNIDPDSMLLLLLVISGSIAGLILQLLIDLGLMAICLKFVDNQTPVLKDLFSLHALLVKFFLASLLVGICVMLGFLLFIIPGVIAALRLSFFGYLIVDQKLDAIAAIKKSWRITQGATGQLFLLALAAVILNILGVLALGIGLLVTIPTTMLASAYVYRKLLATTTTIPILVESPTPVASPTPLSI